MDRLKNIASEAENRFLDLSPQNSPKPQASSTFMTKGNESDFDSKTPRKQESSTLFSTTSSLGVIDIDKASLLSEKEFDTWSPQQSTPYHQRLISEYESQSLNQLKKRLDEISFRNSSFSSESIQNAPVVGNETYNISTNTFRDKIRNSMSSTSSQLVTSSSLQNGEFQSGNLAVLKLDEDQKENRKMFGSLPVSPMNISDSTNDSCEEKEKKFTEFVQMKCYPPEEISQILRNKLDLSYKEEKKKHNDQLKVSSSTDTNQPSRNLPKAPKPQPYQSETFQKLLQNSYMDNSSINSTLDTSCTNSIASINEIAELLKRQSMLAMPKRAVEELLSLGKPKPKPKTASVPPPQPSNSQLQIPPQLQIPYISLSELSSREDTLINSSELFNLPRKLSEKILSSTIRDDISTQNANREKLQKTPVVKNVNAVISNNTDSNRLFSLKLPANSITEPATTSVDHSARDFIDLNVISDVPVANESALSDLNTRQNNLVAAPMHRISNHSLLSADALENDIISAGTLCVGTLAEVICVVENPTNEPLNYKICLKSITLVGGVATSNFPAASVMLASTQDHVVFLPRSETEINVMVTPLMEGKIHITLELISDDKKCSNIIRLIEVIGEMPKFKIIEPQNGVAQFGTMIQHTDKVLPVILQNNGTSKLPLKLMLYEDDRNPICYKVIVNPGETLQTEVNLNTIHMATLSGDSQVLHGKLIILLDMTEGILLRIPLIKTLLLTAKIVKKEFIGIENELPIVLKSSSVSQSVVEFLNVRNNGTMPVEIHAEIDKSSEFNVEPKFIKVFPQQMKTFDITFKANTVRKSREADIYLIVKNPNRRIPVKVIGIVDNDSAPSSSVNSPTRSRNQSYKSLTSLGSSSGSSVAYDGIMELDSTHSSLSWPSIPVHTKKIQTFTLRNRSPAKEKLLLTISDKFNYFKFVENESYVRELRLSLESKESRKISVAFTPDAPDKSINGKIIIIRRNVLLESSMGDFQKRVIPLFGVGGSVKMLFSGVFHDNEDRLWINCESQSFEAKFSLENAGDAEAFVKIVSDELDDKIYPDECTLLPSESIEIHYTLNLNTDRLDMLCKQNSHKEVTLVNRLIVYSGNESNRLRLKRIWSKHPEFDKIQKIRDKMDILNFDSSSQLQIDSLHDDESVFSKLLYEGVTEHAIGVLIPRQNLENVSLDSTVIFKDLNNFTLDHAFNC